MTIYRTVSDCKSCDIAMESIAGRAARLCLRDADRLVSQLHAHQTKTYVGLLRNRLEPVSLVFIVQQQQRLKTVDGSISGGLCRHRHDCAGACVHTATGMQRIAHHQLHDKANTSSVADCLTLTRFCEDHAMPAHFLQLHSDLTAADDPDDRRQGQFQ